MLPRSPFNYVLLVAATLPATQAGLFITSPYEGITCHGGSPCTVTWADDGNTPLLSQIGPSDIALFQGTDTLVQQLAAGLDVSQTHELTFTPDSQAGPDSSQYWIKITSTSAKDTNDTSQPYTSFSGNFALDGMSGSSNSPVASLTSTLPSSSASTVVPSSGSVSASVSSSFSTNGVISTTTLSGIAPSGSDTTLESALSAISSAASGSTAATTSSRASSVSSGSRTNSGAAESSTSNSGAAASSPDTSFTLLVSSTFFGLVAALFLSL